MPLMNPDGGSGSKSGGSFFSNYNKATASGQGIKAPVGTGILKPSLNPAAKKAPSAPAPAPSSYVPPVKTSPSGTVGTTGGGSSYSPPSTGTSSFFGGGGGAPVAPPAPPAPVSVEDWLNQDAGYKDTESALKKALENFMSRYNLDISNYDTEYTAKKGELEKDREFSLDRLMEDYASRGLVKSGLYNQADTRLDGDFNELAGNFDRARSQFKSNLNADKTQFENENKQAKDAAKSQALARRAAQFGLV